MIRSLLLLLLLLLLSLLLFGGTICHVLVGAALLLVDSNAEYGGLLFAIHNSYTMGVSLPQFDFFRPYSMSIDYCADDGVITFSVHNLLALGPRHRHADLLVLMRCWSQRWSAML